MWSSIISKVTLSPVVSKSAVISISPRTLSIIGYRTHAIGHKGSFRTTLDDYEEDADLVQNDEKDDVPDLPGEFVGTPRCPVCNKFMGTGFDGMGLPAAECSAPDCHGFMDDRDLIDAGLFEEQ